MSQVTKIEFHSKGFVGVLKDSRTLAACTALAGKIAASAGEGFEVRSSIGKVRARAAVIAATAEAQRAEAVDKALTSAIGAARG